MASIHRFNVGRKLQLISSRKKNFVVLERMMKFIILNIHFLIILKRVESLAVSKDRTVVVLDSFTADQGDRSLWASLSRHPRVSKCEIFSRTETTAQLHDRIAHADIVLTNKVVLDRKVIEQCSERLCYIGTGISCQLKYL